MEINELNHPDIPSKPAYHNASSLVILFFVLLFYMIVLGLTGGITFVVFKVFFLKWPLFKSLIKLIVYISTMLITIKYAIKQSRKQEGTYFNINFHKVPKWLFPVIIICTLALVVLLLVLLERFSHLVPKPAFVQKHLTKANTTDIFSIITLVIAVPILEEILCRGIVLRGLLKGYPTHKAILISAMFFAAIHINPWQAFSAFFGGLFIGWVYYKTQSVIPGMVIHATINATASAFLFLPNYSKNSLSFLAMPYCYLILCLVAVLVFSMGCIIIQKKILFTPEPAV